MVESGGPIWDMITTMANSIVARDVDDRQSLKTDAILRTTTNNVHDVIKCEKM